MAGEVRALVCLVALAYGGVIVNSNQVAALHRKAKPGLSYLTWLAAVTCGAVCYERLRSCNVPW